MTYRILLFSFMLLRGAAPLAAQQSAAFTNDLVKYNKALTLYSNQQYLPAQALFEQVKDDAKDPTVAADCAYYIANAAVRLNQQGADQLMQNFVEDYPTSTKRNSAFKDVADYYFENGNYGKAKKWYEQTQVGNLSGNEQDRYNFNMGYVHFKTRQPEEALAYFARVHDSEKYGPRAKYYEGFIAYGKDDYDQAKELFEEVEAEEGEKEELSYFKSDLAFKSGDFEEAIAQAKEKMATADRREVSELNKIIGESYFNLKQYSEALPYLKEYKGERGKWTNTDYYQLGYTYYKQGDYENAISEFNKIVDGKNSVAQNAYYHLADAYLKTDRKQEALNAFRNASEMDFDAQIKQDSFYNYAKLSYQIGNAFEATPKVITSFLATYPDAPQKQEMESLLVDSYLTSKNYEAAMGLFESSADFKDPAAYQQVAFYYGIDQYNDAKYDDAVVSFTKALKYPQNPELNAKSLYWKAESEYNVNRIDAAIETFNKFEQSTSASSLPEYKNLSYNLGYAYFKKKSYNQAARYFDRFVKSGDADEVRQGDAYMRLGDSYFIDSKYWPAMEAYNAALEIPSADRDYAAFQKAISYGFVDRKNEKVEGLRDFVSRFPSSSYRDDALYELGNTYVSQQKNQEAIAAYDRLVSEIPQSKFVANALLKKALIYDNTSRTSEALEIFKNVATQFPGTPEGVQAVASAKLIYIDLGQVDEYGRWANSLDYISVEDAELDDAAFASAEKQFVENDGSNARAQFEKYLQEYPTGQRALEAHFYLGQLYFAENQFEKTIPHYKYVLAKERSEFTEQALARLGQVYLSESNYTDAIPVLNRLENESDIPQNTIFAQSNLMKSYSEGKQYDKAVAYAEKVLANSKIDNNVKSDAQIIIARSAMQTGNEARAKEAYAEVQQIATGELGAEALYYEAYFKNKESQYKASNDAVQKLAKDYSGYKAYGGKGLLLMAKNFYALKDAYQATYILDNVISNFSDYPELVAAAKAEQNKIKATESKTNASVEEN